MVPMPPSKPTILVPDPMCQPKVECAKNSMQTRHSELAVVVDPASGFRSQDYCYLIQCKMYHTMNLELITRLIDPFHTLTADTRREPQFDPRSGLDNPGLKRVSQKVKRSTFLLCRNYLLMIAVTVHYLRFTLIKV